MNAKKKLVFFVFVKNKKINENFTSIFNELGQTTKILSRIAHHNFPAANAITDIGSILFPSSISPFPVPCRADTSSSVRSIGLSKSQRPAKIIKQKKQKFLIK